MQSRNHRFPTCWDGKNLDSPNHQDHVSYPESGTFESGGPCPSTHPVRLPQILLETVWETTAFNDPADFVDGQQPFVWSNDDTTGYSNHADYLFGWEDDSLQRAMDGHTYVSAPMLTPQSISQQNGCKVPDIVHEDIDSCKSRSIICSTGHPVTNLYFQGYPIFLVKVPSRHKRDTRGFHCIHKRSLHLDTYRVQIQ